MKQTAIDELLDQVGALCAVYVGKNAPSEQWVETCRRFVELDKVFRRARRQRIAERAKTAVKAKAEPAA